MRLIDADALLEELSNLEPRCANKFVKQGIDDGLHYYMPKILEEQPTIDAVPVVRCGKCIFRDELYSGDVLMCRLKMSGIVKDTDFCSYGEREVTEDEG